MLLGSVVITFALALLHVGKRGDTAVDGWNWRCPRCRAGGGDYPTERAARDGLAEHDYRAGHRLTKQC